MKIRTQNVLAIVPLFLFLAVVSSGLTYQLEREELLWGLREEASSLAVAMAEFIDGDAYRSLVREGTSTSDYARLRTPLERILLRRQAKRIVGLTADGSRVVFNLPDITTPAGKSARTAGGSAADAGRWAQFPAGAIRGLLEALKRDHFFVTEIQRGPGDRAWMRAYAPVRDSAGRPAGILAVETDAGSFLTETRQIVRRAGWITGSVLLLGVGVALSLSGLVTREVEALSRSAVEVKGGNLDRQIRPGRIQEVSDLGNTLNTMSDILRDLLSRTKRALIEAEQFRTQDELAAAYTAQRWPPLDTCWNGTRVVARHVGPRSAGAFFEALPTGGRICAFVGRIGKAEAMEAALAASAACSRLRNELERRPPEEALTAVAGRYELAMLECIWWTPGTETARRWSLAPRAGSSPCEDLSPRPGARFALHTFTEETRRAVDPYLAFFAHFPPDELLADIAALLPDRESGCLMIVECPNGKRPMA